MRKVGTATTTTAAAAGSTAPRDPNLYFSVQRLLTGEPTELVVRSEPFGALNAVDYGALVIFSMLSRYILLKMPGLKWDSGAFKNTRMNYDVWIEALSWLLDGNAFQIFLPMMSPERFPTSNQERLEQLAFPIRRRESRVRMPSNFFAQNYQRRFEIACLLDATLNADHAAIERILDIQDVTAVKTMLSASGTAVIEHLGVERTGTPLQMALYSHDEAAFKMLADQMDLEEVQHQCKAVFDHYKVADYDDLMKKLEADANKLCSEIEVAFKQAKPVEITNALNRVPGTTSTLQIVLNRFNNNLETYVKKNPVHNPYILQRLFKFIDRQLGDDRKSGDWNRDSLLSQQAIAPAQKLSSARWLQHYAKGLCYHRGEGNTELPRSLFTCLGSSLLLDIRSHAVLSRLGVDSCIDIFGDLRVKNRIRGVLSPAEGVCSAVSELLSSKNIELGKFMQPAKSCQSHTSSGCEMM